MCGLDPVLFGLTPRCDVVRSTYRFSDGKTECFGNVHEFFGFQKMIFWSADVIFVFYVIL